MKRELNFFYFFLFLFALGGFTSVHFIHDEINPVHLFFFFYAIGQALLETSALALVAYALRRWAPRWVFFSFVSLTFLFLLAHFTDMTMLRLMDTSLAYFFTYFAGGGLAHMGAALTALNFNTGMICLIIGALLTLPLIGIAFYSITDRAHSRMPLPISLLHLIIVTLGVGMALFLVDIGAHDTLAHATYARYQKRLPLGTSFLPPDPPKIPFSAPFFPLREEGTSSLASETIQGPLTKRPNVYLFIVESTRSDFITEEITPTLASFGSTFLSFPSASSNANCTHYSWYALLHANTPLRWAEARESWHEGGLPLRMMKRLGYRIQVLASADFSLFGVDQLLFGKDRSLPDSILEISTGPSCERDAEIMQRLHQTIRSPEGREGNLYLVFLDSTHSEYSVPEGFAPFQPTDPHIDYFSLPGNPEKLERVKNRYRNALRYVDNLFLSFFQFLKEENLWSDAVVAITGDHGEEFFEEGALFHGTHLNHWQTSVPLLMKLPGNPTLPPISFASHVDLFPTLIHALTGKSNFASFLDGESLLSPRRKRPLLIVQNNGAAPPVDFLLLEGNRHLRARLLPQEGKLALLSVSDERVIELLAKGDREQRGD